MAGKIVEKDAAIKVARKHLSVLEMSERVCKIKCAFAFPKEVW